MSAIIKVSTIGGRLIEEARWEVNSISNLREGHAFQVSLPTSDMNLVAYAGKTGSKECSIDGTKGSYSVVLTCLVKQIRHMLEDGSKQVESMAVLVPSNRVVENVIIYMLSPAKCDPRVSQLIQSSQGLSPG